MEKRIQKIKVVNDNGSEANIFKLILRNLFKNLASIMTFGVYSIVAFFFVSEKHVSKTIHDHIFKTKVIDLTPPSKNKNDSYLGKSDSLTKRGL